MKAFLLLLAAPLALTTACTIETSTTDDISSTQLSGYVDGQPWTLQMGHTDAYLSEGEDSYFATLFPSSFIPCGSFEPSGPHLIVRIPKLVGDYDMDFYRNMTFYTRDTNKVATEGRIVVDSVTSTRITGGLHGYYDFDNEVDGRFDITICDR